MVKTKTKRFLLVFVPIALLCDLLCFCFLLFNGVWQKNYLFPFFKFDSEAVFVCFAWFLGLLSWNFFLAVTIFILRKKPLPKQVILSVLAFFLSTVLVFNTPSLIFPYAWESYTNDPQNFGKVDAYVEDSLNFEDLTFKDFFSFTPQQVDFYNYSYMYIPSHFCRLRMEYKVSLSLEEYLVITEKLKHATRVTFTSCHEERFFNQEKIVFDGCIEIDTEHIYSKYEWEKAEVWCSETESSLFFIFSWFCDW